MQHYESKEILVALRALIDALILGQFAAARVAANNLSS